MIVGVDEVGRGCLAGPVCAAAVILREEIPGLKDSKAICPRKRVALSTLIHAKAIVGKGSASNEEIDVLNIRRATLLAMKRAVDVCTDGIEGPFRIIVDGSDSLGDMVEHPSVAIPKADVSVSEVSAASIVAKVDRDRLMCDYQTRYPAFTFGTHKGYPTKQHKIELSQLGATPIHRRSFKGVLEQ